MKKKGQAIWQRLKQFGRDLLQKGGAAWAGIKGAWGALSGKARALWDKIKRYFQRLASMSRAKARARLAAGDVQFKQRQGVKEASRRPATTAPPIGRRAFPGGRRPFGYGSSLWRRFFRRARSHRRARGRSGRFGRRQGLHRRPGRSLRRRRVPARLAHWRRADRS